MNLHLDRMQERLSSKGELEKANRGHESAGPTGINGTCHGKSCFLVGNDVGRLN